jgi:hypothetical protein
MLFLIVVLALVTAALLLRSQLKLQKSRPADTFRTIDLDPSNLRPLFAPLKKELELDAREKKAREIAKREYLASAEINARVDEALKRWRNDHTISSASELLHVTVSCGREGDFVRAANEILTTFREGGLSGLSADDLALLLESHYRLVPLKERGSGALFLLKEEIAKLRTGSVNKNK